MQHTALTLSCKYLNCKYLSTLKYKHFRTTCLQGWESLRLLQIIFPCLLLQLLRLVGCKERRREVPSPSMFRKRQVRNARSS